VAVAALIGTGTSAAAKASTPKSGGSLTIAATALPTVMDPVRLQMSSTGGTADPPDFALFGTLIYEDTGCKCLKNLMAESLTTSDTGKTWVLKLRSGLKFSDGTTLDATAVKFNWDRAGDATTGSIFIPLMKTMSYTVNDPTTLTITLNMQNTL